MNIKMKTLILLKIFFIFFITTPCFALDWKKDWPSQTDEALQECAKVFPQLQLQAICMENEKKGYDDMQGNFEMPSSVTEKSKQSCSEIFPQFQMQAVCMKNEQDAYKKLNQY